MLRAAGPALAAAVLALALYAVTLGGTYVYDDTFIARDDDGCATRRSGGGTGRATTSTAASTGCTGRWCR